MEPPPLYELTKSFCVAFYDNNQSLLNQLLSADCRMQNKYGKSARGVNGIINCINKLIVLKSNIGMFFPHGQGGSEMFVEIFDSNFSQSCCLLTISTPDKLKRLSVCFGLEWDSNIIIGIVFRFNVDPKTYIRDLYDQDSTDDSAIGRVPTSWDMDVRITGAVLSTVELDELAGRGQEEQYIFLHSKSDAAAEGGAATNGCAAKIHRVSTLSEIALSKSVSSGRGEPSPSCLSSEGRRREQARTVRFSPEVCVILMPEVKIKPNDGLFYSHIDFRRFSTDADEDITELIKKSKSNFMDKEAAKLVLYQNPNIALMTQFNVEIDPNEGERDLSESDGVLPSGPASESSPSTKQQSTQSREPSLTRNLSFDDDVDRESFSRHHGLSVDGAGEDKVGPTQDVSWFDKLYDIITSAIDLDDHAPSTAVTGGKRSTNYFLKSRPAETDDVSLLPLGYSLGRLLTIPPVLDKAEHWTTIEISVIGCNNLKSVLKRLFTRPVDSFVEMRINDQVQVTEIQKNDKNPLYDLSSTYSFRMRSSEARLNNFITFTVLDEGLVDNSILGYAKVSFAALKAQKDNSDPTSIILPLSKHLEDISDIGKGFYNSNNYYLTQNSPVRDSRYSSRDSLSQKNKVVKNAKEVATISVAISKIDPLTHGMLEALRHADEENSNLLIEKDGADIWTK